MTGPLDRHGEQDLRERAKADPDIWAAALAWMIEGARTWYANGRRMSPPPARVQADTHDWRIESDQVLAYLDDRIRFDPERHVMATDLLEDLNDWLRDRGHRPWSDKTLAARFGDHELVNHHHVERRKVRKSSALSRPGNVPDDLHPDRDTAPATYNAWLGLRFAIDEDHEPDPDQDQGRDQPCPVTSNVPDVPANSKLPLVREDEPVSDLPEHPEQEGKQDQPLTHGPAYPCPRCGGYTAGPTPNQEARNPDGWACLEKGCSWSGDQPAPADWTREARPWPRPPPHAAPDPDAAPTARAGNGARTPCAWTRTRPSARPTE